MTLIFIYNDETSFFYQPDTYILNYIFKTMSYNECRLTMGQETIINRHYFMMVQKKSPFGVELTQAYFLLFIYTFYYDNITYNFHYPRSLWFHAYGLNEYWRKKTFHVAPQCMLQYDSQGESVQLVDKARLKLEQFYVPFGALFIGYVLTLIQFLKERFTHF